MLRTLIVDDESSIRQLVRTLLQSAGHEVTVAASGGEALKALGDGIRRDLMVVDISLGDMSGLDVIRACRQKHPDLKILVMSGYIGLDSVELRRALRSESVDHTLPKPFAAQALLQTVREMFIEELPQA